jgi:hypothetical protein
VSDSLGNFDAESTPFCGMELLEHFPQLKDRTANMKYVYYVLDNKTLRDRETVMAEG